MRTTMKGMAKKIIAIQNFLWNAKSSFHRHSIINDRREILRISIESAGFMTSIQSQENISVCSMIGAKVARSHIAATQHVIITINIASVQASNYWSFYQSIHAEIHWSIHWCHIPPGQVLDILEDNTTYKLDTTRWPVTVARPVITVNFQLSSAVNLSSLSYCLCFLSSEQEKKTL